MPVAFAVIGAVIAFIPFASFILIPMEWLMVYLIAQRHNAFELGPYAGVCAAVFTVSAFLKAFAFFLHGLPMVGQCANSVVAFGFILALGTIAENYYSSKAKAK